MITPLKTYCPLFTILTCWVFFATPPALTGQHTMFDELSAIEMLEITIVADWDTLWSYRDDSEMQAKVTFGGETWKADLELRGKSRRKKCHYKPFWLKFKKKGLREAGLAEFNKFKVVTQCLDDEAAPENMNEELLLYEIYNIITDNSFRVKRFTLTMAWPDGAKDPIISDCFIIEPTAEMCARLGGEEVEQYGMPADSIDTTSYLHTAMYQFMIGNYDWNPAIMQNVKLVRVDRSLIIPYDFDYSAIVRPPYQRVPLDLGLTNSRDRIYLGQYFADQINETRQHFLTSEKAVLEYVDNYPHLKKSRRKQVASYLKKFYKLAKDDTEEIDTGYILFSGD